MWMLTANALANIGTIGANTKKNGMDTEESKKCLQHGIVASQQLDAANVPGKRVMLEVNGGMAFNAMQPWI